MAPALRPPSRLRPLAWAPLYLAAGLLAAAAVGHPNLVTERSGLIPTLRGEAYNPYARRALAPALVAAIRAAFPARLDEAVERRMRPLAGSLARRDNPAPDEARRWREMEGHWSVALAGALLNALCFAAFLFVVRALLALFFQPPEVLAGAFPLVSLFSIPIFEEHGTFVYDYPQLFLFTLGLYLVAARRDRAFFALLPFAVLNKETSLLLPIVYLVTRAGTTPVRLLARHVGTQLALGLAVLGVTAYVCRHHVGELVEIHLRENLEEILRAGSWVRFGRVDACPLFPRGLDVPVPLGWNLPGLLGVGLVVAMGWRSAPTFLRRALPTVLLPLVALMLAFGMWSELRALREVLPIVLLLLYAGLRQLRRPWATVTKQAPAPRTP